MVRIKVGQTKTGKTFRALVFITADGEEVMLSFDTVTILRVSNFTYGDLCSLPIGLYDIK